MSSVIDTIASTNVASEPLAAAAPPRRRRLGAADAREAILAAAEGLLVESGPETLRLIEIAARAGVTHPNVLYHFGSVAELERQLAQRVAVRLADGIARVFLLDEGKSMPIERSIDAVFRVFDEGGYARLLAWLALSKNNPTFELLGSRLELVRAAIEAHPALHGDHNAERRLRVVPVIQLVIVAAIGYGIFGRRVEALFPAAERTISAPRVLGELIAPRSSSAEGA
jgi:AcrR family transcriptional regulator